MEYRISGLRLYESISEAIFSAIGAFFIVDVKIPTILRTKNIYPTGRLTCVQD
jgi:hypothetical protein